MIIRDYFYNTVMKNKQRKVGYVTLLGRPSAGKSSFVNAVIDDKISAVSSVPQTTRRLIRGIYTNDDYQIIFQDVPGLHGSKQKWNQSINWVTKNALEDTDVILRVIDGSRSKGPEEEAIDRVISETDKPVVTIVAKADLIKKQARVLYPADTLFVYNITKEGIEEITKKL